MTGFQIYLLGALVSMCFWLFKLRATQSPYEFQNDDYNGAILIFGTILSWASVVYFIVSAIGSKVRSGKFLDF